MDRHIRKVYVSMTETGFYILLCLREEEHGYSIVKKTEQITQGEIKISSGTLYGSLSKMEKDGLIKFIREGTLNDVILVGFIARTLGKIVVVIGSKGQQEALNLGKYD